MLVVGSPCGGKESDDVVKLCLRGGSNKLSGLRPGKSRGQPLAASLAWIEQIRPELWLLG